MANGVISTFARALISGGLTEVGCISEAGKDADGLATCVTDGFIDSPQALAVSPDSKFLYAGADGDPGLTASRSGRVASYSARRLQGLLSPG